MNSKQINSNSSFKYHISVWYEKILQNDFKLFFFSQVMLHYVQLNKKGHFFLFPFLLKILLNFSYIFLIDLETSFIYLIHIKFS